jgi:hypothetical protein
VRFAGIAVFHRPRQIGQQTFRAADEQAQHFFDLAFIVAADATQFFAVKTVFGGVSTRAGAVCCTRLARFGSQRASVLTRSSSRSGLIR